MLYSNSTGGDFLSPKNNPVVMSLFYEKKSPYVGMIEWNKRMVGSNDKFQFVA